MVSDLILKSPFDGFGYTCALFKENLLRAKAVLIGVSINLFLLANPWYSNVKEF
jgi:hypothetical protein